MAAPCEHSVRRVCATKDEVHVAVHEHDISAVASIPGKPTMLDHVLLAASANSTEDELRQLAAWIRTAYLGGRQLAQWSTTSADRAGVQVAASPVSSGHAGAGVDTRGMAGRGTSPTVVGRRAELAVLAEAL